MMKHEDARRLLIEMTPGDFKACKVVVVKERSVLGNHFHRLKDERFLLIKGLAHAVQIGNEMWVDKLAPFEWDVPRLTYHTFDLAAGSVLIGISTREYDAEDENAT